MQTGAPESWKPIYFGDKRSQFIVTTYVSIFTQNAILTLAAYASHAGYFSGVGFLHCCECRLLLDVSCGVLNKLVQWNIQNSRKAATHYSSPVSSISDRTRLLNISRPVIFQSFANWGGVMAPANTPVRYLHRHRISSRVAFKV